MTTIPHMSEGAPPRTIGLALGSGSARGWAHIGVINALCEAGVRVDCVAGTSIGALVGAAYASGKIGSLEESVRELDWRKLISLFDVVFPRSGLVDGKRVADSVREHVVPGDIEDLPLPFCAVSTDLVTGSEVLIDEGDIIEAVRASISVCGIFTPVKKGEMVLVDGGLVNPVPAGVARGMGADYVIAVDLNHHMPGVGGTRRASLTGPERALSGREPATDPASRRVPGGRVSERVMSIDVPWLGQVRQWLARESVLNVFGVLMPSINVMEKQIAEMHLRAEPPDLLIRPELGHLRAMDFHRADEIILEGYRAAKACLEATGNAAAGF